ncbi:hypothetical protein GCM10009677_56420 [Sphaerisporangium rubeum]|uniref:Uncharacterized protein n=1 Tax=Sphaerisporangium rubeum TaxID=321317 RepID=A0A7X0IGI6_9ACTN|nr:hypothetical protein [Sphaerisporangium rubeum]MBB6474548.1 hypothetical protein [Sphaerisporangium rubeum]
MTTVSLAQVKELHGRRWEIMDFYGGWIAYRRQPWSSAAVRFGVSNVVGADNLDDLARQLDEQNQAESRRKSRYPPS